jgi:hypothetical protein
MTLFVGNDGPVIHLTHCIPVQIIILIYCGDGMAVYEHTFSFLLSGNHLIGFDSGKIPGMSIND